MNCLKSRQNSAAFTRELLVSVSLPEEVVDLSSDLRQPDYEVAKWNLVEEKAKRNPVREEVDPASDTVQSVPRAGAPMGNWQVTSDVCSSILLVTSGAVTIVPTVPGAVCLVCSFMFSETQ